MTDQAGPEAAARAIQDAWDRPGATCPPVRTLFADGDVAGAYAAQDIGTKHALKQGRRLVGRKIGLTSPAVQKQLGVSEPDYGMLFDDMDVPLGAPVSWSRLRQPRVEAEVAFVLGRDLDRDGLTTADVLSAIDYAVAAIEIVDSRIAGWDIRLVDTIADNASSGLYVLGHEPRKLSRFDVVGAKMAMTRGEETVSSGAGSACLGSPVSAALWLARVMQRLGRPLAAGDVILSGALGPMISVKPGETYTARIEGLGSVQAIFE